jgi:hypothetical protein
MGRAVSAGSPLERGCAGVADANLGFLRCWHELEAFHHGDVPASKGHEGKDALSRHLGIDQP